MFRKYTRLTAAIMLVSVLSAGFAAAEGTIPTCRGDGGSNRRICTTSQDFCATYANHVPTCAPNSCCFSKSIPTELPPKAELSASSSGQAASPGDDYTTQSVMMQEQIMMNLLNQDRKNNGRAALVLDEELSRIARIKSADMRDNGYFAHESPTYGNVRDMLKRFGYSHTAAGENIAHHANVDKAQAAFMSSQGHRANILSAAWTKVGIGIVYDRNGYIYATQIFAK